MVTSLLTPCARLSVRGLHAAVGMSSERFDEAYVILGGNPGWSWLRKDTADELPGQCARRFSLG
jgi:hypothetical protein